MRGRLQGHLTRRTLSPQDPALMALAASRLLLRAVNKGPGSGALTEAWVHFVTQPTTTPGARDPVPSSRGRRPKAERGQGLAPGASLGALELGAPRRPALHPAVPWQSGREGGKLSVWSPKCLSCKAAWSGPGEVGHPCTHVAGPLLPPSAKAHIYSGSGLASWGRKG